MNVIDLSATREHEPVTHHPALLNSILGSIIGPSGSGKTQLLINLIIRWLKWDKLYLVEPPVDEQRCYSVLKEFNQSLKVLDDDDISNLITDINEAPSVVDHFPIIYSSWEGHPAGLQSSHPDASEASIYPSRPYFVQRLGFGDVLYATVYTLSKM